MSFTLTEFAPWITVIGSALGSIIAVTTLISRRLSKQDEELLRLRLELIEEQKKRIIQETQFNIFWDYYKQEAPKVLLKPHTPEVDQYMLKMHKQKGELAKEDKEQLVKLLQELLDAQYDVYNIDKERGTYLALLARFKTELKMPEEIDLINKRYDEEFDRLHEQYEERTRRKRRFWNW